ncbi:hypothetical protein ACLOJK_018558 [Asimina triloba]
MGKLTEISPNRKGEAVVVQFAVGLEDGSPGVVGSRQSCDQMGFADEGGDGFELPILVAMADFDGASSNLEKMPTVLRPGFGNCRSTADRDEVVACCCRSLATHWISPDLRGAPRL